MRFNRTAVVTVTAVAIVGLIGVMHLHGQQGGARPAPVTVAVVNVLKVMNSATEKADIEAELVALVEKFQEDVQKRQQEIKSLQDDIEILNKGTAARKAKQEELQKKAIHLDSWGKFEQRKNEVERIVRYEALYRKVLDEIAVIAERDGYDLVLYNDYSKDLNVQTGQQLQANILLRKLVYVKGELDMTDQVIQQLDNKYAAGED